MPENRCIAELLAAAPRERDRKRIVRGLAAESAILVARELKAICFESWTTEPTVARRTALALKTLAGTYSDREIGALAHWVAGIAALTSGKLADAANELGRAHDAFLGLEMKLDGANTLVATMIPLALLGRYAEAVKTGKSALRTFELFDDEVSAGKVEKNLGNIVARYGRESDAERYYLSARARFAKIGDLAELTMADNSLANTYAELNDFHRAEEFYASALANARSEGMRVTEAEIEASMGRLALFRGRFDDALRLLEFSRQKYETLGMPHQTAIAELEIADTYLELNLIDEAAAIYERVAETLKRLKLRGEEARARANFGKAALHRNEYRKAENELGKAAALFSAEKDPTGAAGAKLTEAELEIGRNDLRQALKLIRDAERLLKRGENGRLKLFAAWLRGETLRLLGDVPRAERVLGETLDEALRNEQSNLAIACLKSLGDAVVKSDPKLAKGRYRRAVRLIESLRAPLPAEEFQMAFLADKLAPYQSLAKIHIAENDLPNAFRMIEKARARTLVDALNADGENGVAGDSKLSETLAGLREELNWFYSRLNRAEADSLAEIQREIRRRERSIANVARQIGSTGTGRTSKGPADFDLRRLQASVGPDRALIEFVEFDNIISAFVLKNDGLEYFPDLTTRDEVLALLEGLQFQFGALRYGTAHLAAFVPQLKSRADNYLSKLFDLLFAPLETAVGARNLIVVPVGPVHYVPFHALRRERYLIEDREVVYAPGAAVWEHLNSKPFPRPKNALLVGFADESIPLVEKEIGILSGILANSESLTGSAAGFGAFAEKSPGFDILHLACHGQFRPDNPMFSSLSLADGFVTVRDLCARRLRASVVTLSACETGLNTISAGEEILGLARGFLSAGAQNLVLSLWTVNDSAAAGLMTSFYENFLRGNGVAASLRLAQLRFIDENTHPYFWSPFIAIGR